MFFKVDLYGTPYTTNVSRTYIQASELGLALMLNYFDFSKYISIYHKCNFLECLEIVTTKLLAEFAT